MHCVPQHELWLDGHLPILGTSPHLHIFTASRLCRKVPTTMCCVPPPVAGCLHNPIGCCGCLLATTSVAFLCLHVIAFRGLLFPEIFSVGCHCLSACRCQYVAVTACHRSEIFPGDVLCLDQGLFHSLGPGPIDPHPGCGP